ncbi:MAG: winged helix-turn-helix domain-containing protein [Pseudomonadota bacterium]
MKFAFGEFELNAAQRSLAQAGSVISIEPKAFDVLVFLIKKRDRMVSRDELLEECWAGIYVSDGTLSRCLSRVRQALGQDRKASSPILTVHTKGYRFVEELSFAGDLELEEEVTPIDEEPFEAQSLGVERRFVSIVNTVIFSSGASQEERQQKGLSFAAECRNLAASHGVETLSSSSSEVVIQVGYPRAIERPAAVAVSVAGGIFEAGRKTGLGIRVTVSSGIAVSDDRPDRTTIAGLEPLRIVGSVAPGEAEFLIDDRTA